MDSSSRLGANIRALRKAYGETQEELGAILNVEKNTVSYYENGKREPNKEMLSEIAKHFMVSVEELMFCDLTGIGTITVDNTVFFKNVDIILPIVVTEKALSNENFKKAYEQHKMFYNELHKASLDCMDNIDVCIDGYLEAYEDEKIKPEAAANFLSIWNLLCMMITTVPQTMKNRPAALIQVAARDPKAKEIIENPNPDLEKDSEEMSESLKDPEMTEMIDDMMTTLKHSFEWSDIADYYIALRYTWNLIDNDLGPDFNRRVGAEMLNALVSVRNVYAARFLKFSIDSIGQSSQTVDDN